jgi:hypothetical protein
VEAMSKRVLDQMVDEAMPHITQMVERVKSGPSFFDIIRDGTSSALSVVAPGLLPPPVRSFTDPATQGISTFYFGRAAIKSEFRERLVRLYEPILEVVRRIKNPWRANVIYELALSIRTACNRAEQSNLPRTRQLLEEHAEQTMTVLVRLAEDLLEQELSDLRARSN